METKCGCGMQLQTAVLFHNSSIQNEIQNTFQENYRPATFSNTTGERLFPQDSFTTLQDISTAQLHKPRRHYLTTALFPNTTLQHNVFPTLQSARLLYINLLQHCSTRLLNRYRTLLLQHISAADPCEATLYHSTSTLLRKSNTSHTLLHHTATLLNITLLQYSSSARLRQDYCGTLFSNATTCYYSTTLFSNKYDGTFCATLLSAEMMLQLQPP